MTGCEKRVQLKSPNLSLLSASNMPHVLHILPHRHPQALWPAESSLAKMTEPSAAK